MTLVRVKTGLSHAHYEAGEVFDASPAEVVSFGDKFEMVETETETMETAPIVVGPKGETETPSEDVREVAITDVKVVETVPSLEVAIGDEATPAARRLADEAGLDLSGVHGTGKDGRVTAGDVRAAMEG